MARVSDGTDVTVSPVPASSSNMGSLNGSLPDLEGTGNRGQYDGGENQRNVHTNRKIAATLQSISRFENCVQTLSQTVASSDASITKY